MTLSADPGLSRHWGLDPSIAFLNHGSFGACPIEVLAEQSRLREQMEREPVRFFIRELEPLLDAARAALGDFVGSDPDDLAFVPNPTTAVNAVVRSIPLGPGDELLVTDHEYNACRNALEEAAARSGARVVVARVPFPIDSPDRVVEAVLAAAGPRTRLALVDHVTSQTGLVFPVAPIVSALRERGIDTLVDGAHAPGMLPLSIRALEPAYYTGTCHKWICAPKGAAFLYVRRDRQASVRPPAVSHGYNSPRADRSRFRLEFDWTGTDDPTAYLCVPAALRVMGSLVPGGWREVRERNRAAALAARSVLCRALAVQPPSPDEMIGALAAVPLPDGAPGAPPSPLYFDPLQDALLDRHRIEVPIIPWPLPPRRLVRVSAQLYNAPHQYEALAAALAVELGRSGPVSPPPGTPAS